MLQALKIDKIEESLAVFHLLYDSVRMVEPVKKQVLACRCGEAVETGEACYDCWNQGGICDNCISIRAHYEQKSIMKLELCGESITMVTALPVGTPERPLVLELIKDVTDSMVFPAGLAADGEQLYQTIRQLNELATRDTLTTLYNRRFADERLPADLAACAHRGQPLSVLFLDVDDFKAINDTLGHETGDHVLRAAAEQIGRCIRADKDWAARYGGDEFLVCLGDTDAEAALTVALRIRETLAHAPAEIDNTRIPITLSIGIGTMRDTVLTAAEIIKQADLRMYRSKSGGKNRITGETEEAPQG